MGCSLDARSLGGLTRGAFLRFAVQHALPQFNGVGTIPAATAVFQSRLHTTWLSITMVSSLGERPVGEGLAHGNVKNLEMAWKHVVVPIADGIRRCPTTWQRSGRSATTESTRCIASTRRFELRGSRCGGVPEANGRGPGVFPRLVRLGKSLAIMFRVKICGITNEEDARAVATAGADAVGLNFYQESPRFLSPAPAQAVVQGLARRGREGRAVRQCSAEAVIGTFRSTGLDLIQIHGDEPPSTSPRSAIGP